MDRQRAPAARSYITHIALAAGVGGSFLGRADVLELGGVMATMLPNKELQRGQAEAPDKELQPAAAVQAEEMAAQSINVSPALHEATTACSSSLSRAEPGDAP